MQLLYPYRCGCYKSLPNGEYRKHPSFNSAVALFIDDSAQYDVVKSAILKAYELVPEAYRQKFRSVTKTDNQTHVEFARIKESLYDRWCTSKEIEENFVKLRQLILIEEFKNCVSCDVKTYLDEKKAQTLKEAAVLADDYVLTYKGMPIQRISSLNQGAPQVIRGQDIMT